jgi:riboflavin kinase/FMN adenylyltransferase
VLTFDPPPREFFAKATAPGTAVVRPGQGRAVRGARRRAHVRGAFDGRLAALEPEAFIDAVLVRRLGVRWLLVGEDFRFGRGRTGDLATLRRNARAFSVEGMRTVTIDGERASSTAVRAALAAGNLERAGSLLGRPFAIWGRVAHGAKLGRHLGFPTANLPLRRKPPVSGIFAVRVHGLGSAPVTGVASVGVRPTVTDAGVPWSKPSCSTSTPPSTGAASASSSCTSCATRSDTPTSVR